jgi:NAD(P)-dependent dehydrogenase (short-subunit alcohol dehydrogenase family)
VRGRLLELGVEEWDETFSVNTRGVFLCLQAVARAIVEAEKDGSMVLVSSVNGMISDPGIPSYSASKAAVYHLARCAAVELGGYGIRVNAVGPGPTDTPMIAVNMQTPGYRDAVKEATPLGRMGTPELVADGIVNVLRSDWITGQAIMIDGGAALVTPRGRARMVGRESRTAAARVA